jgi:hypothetical protein
MGEDVSDLLDMIAAQMKVLQIARIKKSCRRCEKMVQEPAPSRPIPGSMAPLGHVNMPCRAVGPKPAGPHSRLEVRRSPSFISPTRNLRAHGRGHP